MHLGGRKRLNRCAQTLPEKKRCTAASGSASPSFLPSELPKGRHRARGASGGGGLRPPSPAASPPRAAPEGGATAPACGRPEPGRAARETLAGGDPAEKPRAGGRGAAGGAALAEGLDARCCHLGLPFPCAAWRLSVPRLSVFLVVLVSSSPLPPLFSNILNYFLHYGNSQAIGETWASGPSSMGGVSEGLQALLHPGRAVARGRYDPKSHWLNTCS